MIVYSFPVLSACEAPVTQVIHVLVTCGVCVSFFGVSYRLKYVGVVGSFPHKQANSKVEFCPFDLVP